ncbi:MAG TPA: PTS sugar transporter subunit IIB [Candidatus Salinicoccus stercoripullorum]|uniref:PTS sugar transporter subunit IIB n=1 Tax=Candidatus Salinicoccus stercoripullorum TaxID=2838756 RepID=A0A9D1QH62_9STAP|nr:PTS sugar transporter subunit IIB [Candidatus Salinicoccus stercoripullorum]
MKNILLACSSGMSTSLLVSKMESAADSLGADVKIWAVGQDKAIADLPTADVLLIGPQMRFMQKKFSKAAEEYSVPVEVIDSVAYGRVDGEAVLKRALELAEK